MAQHSMAKLAIYHNLIVIKSGYSIFIIREIILTMELFCLLVLFKMQLIIIAN